ncbi:MAG: SpoIIE family protein phosphatase [Lachnospiraceae bacterium]|nr:SpoIIE family protein phosphatase [Lachnospiraceae bacterium]
MMWRKKTAGRWLLYLGIIGGATAFCTGLIGCLWKESTMKYIGLGALVAGFVFLFLWTGEQALWILLKSGREELIRADIRNHTKKRLLEAAASFDVLSGVFDGVAEEDAEDFRNFAVTLPEVVCADCARMKECWETYPEERFAAAYLMYEAARHGEVPGHAEVEYRLGGCLRAERITEEYAVLPLRERANQYVRRRTEEGRAAVVNQLRVVSDMLKEYSDELYETTLGDGKLEENVAEALKHIGIYAEQIAVMRRNGRGLRIRLQAYCKNGQYIPVRRAVQCLGMLFHCPMIAGGESERFISETMGDFTFEEEPGYMILTGVAKATQKDESVSGDSFAFLYPDSGETILLLSDGMGSGEAASRDSEAVIGLLEQFLAAGFDEKTAVRLINSVLLLRTEGKSYSTVDISIINPYGGTCEFIKLGAAGTYIKRDNWIESVESATLPVGILGDADYDTKEKKLFDGEYIIMMSDGVPEALGEHMEEVLFAAGKKQTDRTPQGVAGEILKAALDLCDYKPTDDMTVLVAELVKKQPPYYLQSQSGAAGEAN